MIENIIKELFPRFEICEIENGSTVYVLPSASRFDLDLIKCKLRSLGYNLYTENAIGENAFAILTGNGRILSLGYFPRVAMIRIVSEATGHLPKAREDNSYKAVALPFLSQRRCPNLLDNAGMSYVIRLCDGRFILIDGGFDDHDAAGELVQFLESNNVCGEKPIIAAVFITHSHNDHIGVITRLLKSYRDRLVFGDFIFNWPSKKLCQYSDVSVHTELDAELESIEGVNVIYARTGQQFHYADASFEMLFTPDDVYPEYIEKFNDSSLVMRMTLNRHRVLWMGDAGARAVEILLERYSPSVFECEVLQVTHHGYGGGNPELDRAANPRILLWPAPDYWYRTVRKWKHNEYLIGSDHIEEIYVAGRGSVTLNFGEQIEPLYQERQEEVEGVLYRQDLSLSTPCKANLTAIVTKKNRLVGVNITETPRGFLLSPGSDGRVLIEVLNPSTMTQAPSFSLTVKGKGEDRHTKFGILPNCPVPTSWSGEDFITICSNDDEFEAKFYADNQKGEAYLETNGKRTLVEGYSFVEGCGLHLALVSGEVTISYIEVTELKNKTDKVIF